MAHLLMAGRCHQKNNSSLTSLKKSEIQNRLNKVGNILLKNCEVWRSACSYPNDCKMLEPDQKPH